MACRINSLAVMPAEDRKWVGWVEETQCAQPYLSARCTSWKGCQRCCEVLRCCRRTASIASLLGHQSYCLTPSSSIQLQFSHYYCKGQLCKKMLSHAGIPSRDRDTTSVHQQPLCRREATASCPVPPRGQSPVQPFELPSSHVSAGARQKAEAEASGLFNAFYVTHCSPFLEIRPVPHSALTAEDKLCASMSLLCICCLRAKRTLPHFPTNGLPEGFTSIFAIPAVARFVQTLQGAELSKTSLSSQGEAPEAALGSSLAVSLALPSVTDRWLPEVFVTPTVS